MAHRRGAQAATFRLAGRRASRDDHARPPRAQEPADVRVVRGAERHLPRPDVVDGRARRRDHRRGRQLLLRRRRARDHRPARRDASTGDTEAARFTRMTGDLVKAMRACPQPIVAAVDGVCAGAGAILAMASDLRFGTPRSKVAFLFVRVGLAGADMGACAMLPRIIGQGRASELLFTGRFMDGDEAERWGFFNRLCATGRVLAEAHGACARSLADGPTFAHAHDQDDAARGMGHGDRRRRSTPRRRRRPLCMQTEDFARAYRAFVEKQPPGSKATDGAPIRTYLSLAVLHGRASRAAARARALGAIDISALMTMPTPATSTRCRERRVALGEAGWLRHAVPRAHRRRATTRSTCDRSASFARRSATRTGLADFAFAMQGLGTGPISPVRQRRAEAPLPAARRRGRRHRGVRASRRPTPAPTSPRCAHGAPRRRRVS